MNEDPNGDNGGVVEQVREAYTGTGCYGFLPDTWITDTTTLEDALRVVGTYNAFDPAEVRDRLPDLDETDVRVGVGREDSPVLYVETPVSDGVVNAFDGVADEIEVVPPSEVGRVRRFETIGVDPHNVCTHDDPVVPDDAVIASDASRETVRLWWD